MSGKLMLFVVWLCLAFCMVSCSTKPASSALAPSVLVPVEVVVPAGQAAPSKIDVPAPPRDLPKGPLALFGEVRLAMSRPNVETLLGDPIAAEAKQNGIVEVWYMSAPPVTKPQFPQSGAGAILVVYKDGRVVEKRLNPQL